MLASLLTARSAAAGGGGPSSGNFGQPRRPPLMYKPAPRATLGSNTAVLATGRIRCHLPNMPVGTVLPLRQSILDVAPGFL